MSLWEQNGQLDLARADQQHSLFDDVVLGRLVATVEQLLGHMAACRRMRGQLQCSSLWELLLTEGVERESEEVADESTSVGLSELGAAVFEAAGDEEVACGVEASQLTLTSRCDPQPTKLAHAERMKMVADGAEDGVPPAVGGGAPHTLLEEERALLIVLSDHTQDEGL